MIKKQKDFQLFIKTLEQTKRTLEEAFKKHTNETLAYQLFGLLRHHPQQKEVAAILEDFLELVSDYEINDLLTPGAKIPGYENNPFLSAAIGLGISKLLIDISWDLFGEKIYNGSDALWDFDRTSKEANLLRILTNTVKYKLVLSALYDIFDVAVSKKEYKDFQAKLKAYSNPMQMAAFEEATKDDPKSDLIVFLGVFRLYLEAVFFILHDPDFDPNAAE